VFWWCFFFFFFFFFCVDASGRIPDVRKQHPFPCTSPFPAAVVLADGTTSASRYKELPTTFSLQAMQTSSVNEKRLHQEHSSFSANDLRKTMIATRRYELNPPFLTESLLFLSRDRRVETGPPFVRTRIVRTHQPFPLRHLLPHMSTSQRLLLLEPLSYTR